MAAERRRHWRATFWLVAVGMLSGCSQKWEAMEFAEAGFAATFPMPVMSQPKDGGILHHWAHAGDVQLQVVRSPAPQGVVPSAGQVEALKVYYEALRSMGNATEVSSPTIGQIQDRYATIEFHISGKTQDGTSADTKGRLVYAGNHIFVASGLWPSGDKKGLLHAGRFLDSFKITQ